MSDPIKFVLRIPPSLHKKIKRRAKTKNTSMNREIVNLLNERLSDAKSTEQLLEELISRLEEKGVI